METNYLYNKGKLVFLFIKGGYYKKMKYLELKFMDYRLFPMGLKLR